MTRITVNWLLATSLIAGVYAQTPAYFSPVLLQPGLNGNKCFTASSNSDGAAVTIQDCVFPPTDAQKWTFDGGNVKIFGNSKCLDVTDGNTNDGTKLQIWTCSNNGNANQNFFYTGDYRLSWTNHGKCVDLTDGSLSNGNRLQLWSCGSNNPNQVWNTGYSFAALPSQSESGQTGTNACAYPGSSDPNGNCQTLVLNTLTDFCLFGPPNPSSTIGDTEREEITWCTASNRFGTRTIPNGTFTGVHFVKTPDYVQITGVGDFKKINIRGGDAGGELDPHGADGNGNPVGGLVYGGQFATGQGELQYHEWTEFISDSEFCIRACVGPNAAVNCNHIYDEMGCFWNMPANYDPGFESCLGDSDLPMGVYGTSTWFQGVSPTPSAHPAAPSSACVSAATITPAPV